MCAATTGPMMQSDRNECDQTQQETTWRDTWLNEPIPDRLEVPLTAEGAKLVRSVIDHNNESGVHWLYSYVSEDHRISYDVYDGPNPDAIRKAAEATRCPVDRITKVSVLSPYSYR